jgi:hypothetical protein
VAAAERPRVTMAAAVRRVIASARCPWQAAASAGVDTTPFDHQVVGVAGKAIDGTLRPDGVGKRRELFVRAAIQSHDDRPGAVTLEEQLIEVRLSMRAPRHRDHLVHGIIITRSVAVPHHRTLECSDRFFVDFAKRSSESDDSLGISSKDRGLALIRYRPVLLTQ